MIMLLTCSNFPDELSENDELREFELTGSDCIFRDIETKTIMVSSVFPNHMTTAMTSLQLASFWILPQVTM